MKDLSIRKCLTSGVVAAGAVGTLLAGSALAAPTANLLQDVTYTTTGSTGFCQTDAPTSVEGAGGGTVSQSRNRAGNGPVGLSIASTGGYADDGFYKPVGTLGELSGYTVKGKGAAFGDNLWFDRDKDGSYFTWDGDNCLSGLGGDAYGLGPASTPRDHDQQTLTVDGNSAFGIQNGACGADYEVTLDQLKAGHCAGIDASTPVAVWVGITAGSGGSLDTTITAAHLTK